MSKKFIPMIAMVMLSLAVQAEESQEKPKCPDDPTEFKGKEDDCFDCLEGALSNLKLFSIDLNKTLEDKKLTTAEEIESKKTRSENLWEGVEGWQKVCEPKPEAKEKPKADSKTGADEESKEKPKAEAEEETKEETEAEPKTEENTEGEAESGTEEAAEPKADAEPEAEPETEP